jgi:7,8-dihydropterin-6-yl-methyl-4-(beta-D-ribofuranosyl)aminobenzene 5'-phosphate synthase
MPTLTLLTENTAKGECILAEHGLSYWLEIGTHRVLFDTGQGFVFAKNAAHLKIPLENADAIVLSHGHIDHVGGLAEALERAPNAMLFLHPDATAPKYSGSTGVGRRISTRFVETQQFVTPTRKIVWTTEPHEVVPGVWCTGTIPRVTDFEDTGGPFFLDKELTRPDPLLDDQSLFIPTPQGTIVIAGCAHAGIVNTLRHIRTLTDNAPIHTVLGGLHLNQASDKRMAETLAYLSSLGDTVRMGFCHCTGFKAILRLWNAFPNQCFECKCGSVIEF